MSVPLALVPVLFAVEPFLPPGRGALILILGGLVVLPVSLMMSRVGVRTPRAPARATTRTRPARPAPAPRHAAPAPHGPVHGMEFVEVAAPAPSQPSQQWLPVPLSGPSPGVAHVAAVQVTGPRPWGGTGLERAIRQAVGATQLRAAEPGRYVVELGRCDSCAHHRRGCEAERHAIERAVASYLRDARVTEVACGQAGRRAGCTFDIRGR